MSKFWFTVTDSQSGETLLTRQMTTAEMNEPEAGQALRFAQEAFDGMIEINPEEDESFPDLAPIVVTYYRRKRDINSGPCWSMHGFYPAR